MRAAWSMVCLSAWALCAWSTSAGEKATAPGFAEGPALVRHGDTVRIRFTAKGTCDATVAIEDAHGRIVRHLACGMLGENAPPPFQRGSLAQNLTWDGKDDHGRYIDDTSGLTVRVSLGLKPRFEKSLFWSPHKRVGARPPLMVPTKEGVVVFDGLGVDHVRLYGHAGNYVRTIYPFPASKLGGVAGLRHHTFPGDTQSVPLKDGFVQASLLTSGTSGMSDAEKHRGGVAATALAVHGSRIALAYDRVNRLATDGTSGGLRLTGPRVSLRGRISKDDKQSLLVGPTSAAFSPDGRTLYLTGHIWHWLVGGWRKVSGWFNVVMRLEFEKDAEPEVFLGSREQWKTGEGHENFRMPTSIACDAKGRLYVADYLNDRVQIFAPGGRHLATAAARRPSKVLLHHRTGELYVLSWTQLGDKRFEPSLTRFGPFPDLKKAGTWPLPLERSERSLSSSGQSYEAALDSYTDPPTIWLVGRKPLWTGVDVHFWGAGTVTRAAEDPWLNAGIRLLVLEDGKWSVKRNFAEDAQKAVVRAKAPDFSRQRLFFNPRDRRLYVAEDRGFGKSFCELVRIDPETGKTDLVPLPFDAEDMAFDLDGLAYLRTDKLVVRYDSRTWKEVPWDYGEKRQSVFFDTMTGGKRVERVIAGLATPGSRPVCWHQGGMWVSPRGHLAVACCSRSRPPKRKDWKARHQTRVGKPYAPPLYPGRVRWNEIHVWDRYGKLLYEDAFPGMTQINGLHIDQHDALYVMGSPARILDGRKCFDEMTGTVVKVKPGKAKVLAANPRAALPLSDQRRPKRPPDVHNSHLGDAWVEGAEWMYGGVGYCGFNTARAGGGCDCWHSRFVVDFFNRTFAPEIGRYSVAVLDTAGNRILRIGRYGNVDDGEPLVALEGKPTPRQVGGDEVALFHAAYLGTDTDRRLFIADAGNGRILNVKLGYRATATVALKEVPDTGQ